MSKRVDYLIIGKFIKPFGIKGELKLLPITDNPDRFKQLDFAFTKKKSSFEKIEIESARNCEKYVLLKIKDINSRDDAELLRGELLYINRENAIKIDKDSYYYYDLLGCKVIALDGELIGELIDIRNTGDYDIYLIRSNKDEKKEYMIPAVSDIVKNIDINAKEIKIKVLNGLFDQ